MEPNFALELIILCLYQYINPSIRLANLIYCHWYSRKSCFGFLRLIFITSLLKILKISGHFIKFDHCNPCIFQGYLVHFHPSKYLEINVEATYAWFFLPMVANHIPIFVSQKPPSTWSCQFVIGTNLKESMLT